MCIERTFEVAFYYWVKFYTHTLCINILNICINRLKTYLIKFSTTVFFLFFFSFEGGLKGFPVTLQSGRINHLYRLILPTNFTKIQQNCQFRGLPPKSFERKMKMFPVFLKGYFQNMTSYEKSNDWMSYCLREGWTQQMVPKYWHCQKGA